MATADVDDQVLPTANAVDVGGSTLAVRACAVLIEIFAAHVAVIRWAIAGMQSVAAIASVYHASATRRTKVLGRVVFQLATFHARKVGGTVDA